MNIDPWKLPQDLPDPFVSIGYFIGNVIIVRNFFEIADHVYYLLRWRKQLLDCVKLAGP